MAGGFTRPTGHAVRYAESVMNRPNVARLVAILAWPLAACEYEKPCMDGYARDNEGRCHPIADNDEDDNTAPTAPSVSLLPSAGLLHLSLLPRWQKDQDGPPLLTPSSHG